VNCNNSLVVTITVTCYLWAPSIGDHLFTCGAISRQPQMVNYRPVSRALRDWVVVRRRGRT